MARSSHPDREWATTRRTPSQSQNTREGAASTTSFIAAILGAGSAAASDLSFLELHASGTGGVTDLDHAASCDVSPDGADVYVAANASHAVAWFQRDPTTGRLAFMGSYVDGVGGVDGLLNCADDAVSVLLIALFADRFESGDTTSWGAP